MAEAFSVGSYPMQLMENARQILFITLVRKLYNVVIH